MKDPKRKYDLYDGKVIYKFEYFTNYRDSLNALKFRKRIQWRVYQSEDDFKNDSIWFSEYKTKKECIESIKTINK